MASSNHIMFTCAVCRLEKPEHEGKPIELVNHPIDDLIRKKSADIGPHDLICRECRNQARMEFVESVLETEKGELSSLEEEVVKSLSQQELLSKNINPEFETTLTLGERVADRVATFGGSWRFIIIFGVILLLWIVANSVMLLKRPFDPYPFILLNLVLSCLAALQAPVIMMSQNRQAAKDRLRAEHDYQINLKAEIEIRHLNVKIDQLLTHQWKRLLDIQRIQMELMEDLPDRDSGDQAGPG